MPEGITISPQPSEVGSISVRDAVRAFSGKTSAPTGNDDITAGYIVSDLWIDETGDAAYQCLDNTNGAAVWSQIDASAVPAAHTIASHSDTTATGTELETLTGGGDTILHDHDGISENTNARHTQGTDVALGTVGTKATPVDADLVLQRNSESASALVTSTWTQIKAFMKTYWDTLYLALAAVTNSYHYTGFPDRNSTSLAWDDGAYTLTLTATTDQIWINGISYSINTLTKQLSVAQEAVSGVYWFWITAPGGTPQLNASTTALDIGGGGANAGFDQCLVASVYWNTTTSKGILSDERHWFGRDCWMHEYLHETVGARYYDGMAGTFDDTTITIEAGELYDEDIEHENTQQTTVKVLYHNGDADWAWDTLTTPYKVVNPGVDNTLRYNNGTALASVDNNKYVNYWVYITPDTAHPVHVIIGTAQYNTIALVRAATFPSLGALPSPEFKLIYKITYQNDGGTPDYIEATDYRAVSNLPSDSYVATNHSLLSYLSWSQSGHTIDGDIAMGTNKLTDLKVPNTAGDSIRATAKITEVALESAIDLKHTAGTDPNDHASGSDNQTRADLSLATTDSPVFVTVKLSGLSDGKIPIHTDDATGLVDGPTGTDVASAVSLKHTAGTDPNDHASGSDDQDLSGYYLIANLEDTPTEDEADKAPTSEWAFDHDANTTAHHDNSGDHTQGTDTALGAVGTKNPPVDADLMMYRNSAASNVLVTSTNTQYKAFLKTYFDTLYNQYVHPNHSGDVTSVADGAQTIANKETLSATSPITLSNTPTVIAGAAPVIAIPAATNAIPGHATAAHIQAIEANTDKPHFNTVAVLGTL